MLDVGLTLDIIIVVHISLLLIELNSREFSFLIAFFQIKKFIDNHQLC